LATAYWKQNQFDDALPPLRKVLEKSPKDAEANGVMADILQHKGDNAGAKKYAQAALAANPALIETRVVLARVYLAEQEPKMAIVELKKVSAADTDGSYHFLLYRALREAGDEQAAKAAMAEFQQLRYGSRHE
jgi:predicted Zn-dependent protease